MRLLLDAICREQHSVGSSRPRWLTDHRWPQLLAEAGGPAWILSAAQVVLYSVCSPGILPSKYTRYMCWAQFAHRLSLQTATLSLQTGRFQRPVCRLGETLAQFANWVSVCKLRQPSLQTR